MKKNINNIDNANRKLFRPLNLFKGLFVISILLIIVFNFIPRKAKFYIKYKIDDLTLNLSYLGNTDSYNTFKNSIQSNNHIDDDYKKMLITLYEDEYKENEKYIDLARINKKVSTFDVNYNELLNTKNKDIAAFYSASLNEINYYNIKDINDIDLGIVFHESNHLISDYSLFNKYNRGFLNDNNNENILAEGINELFTREYILKYEDENNLKLYKSYEKYMPYIYLLNELLDEDVIRKYNFNNNESIIINGLLDIDNNIEQVYILIESLNNIVGLNNVLKNGSSNVSESYVYIMKNQENFKKAYSYLFNKKYGFDAEHDLISLLYFKELNMLNEIEEERLLNYLEINDIDLILEINNKGYISNYAKEKNPNMIIKIFKNKIINEIEIDNNIRNIK